MEREENWGERSENGLRYVRDGIFLGVMGKSGEMIIGDSERHLEDQDCSPKTCD